MAIARVEITCAKCGCVFRHEKGCHNRRLANEYETWAADHIELCPACYAKQRADEKAAKLYEVLAKYNITLANIEGVSERQIAYAEDIRERCLANNIAYIGDYAKIRAKLADEEKVAKMRRRYEAHGVTFAEGLWCDMIKKCVTKIDVMLNVTDASEIIDEGKAGYAADYDHFIKRYEEWNDEEHHDD